MASLHSYSPRKRANLGFGKLVGAHRPFINCDDYGQLQEDITVHKREKIIFGNISGEKISVSGIQEIAEKKRVQESPKISILSGETFCSATSQSFFVEAVHKPEVKSDIIPLSRFLVKNSDALIILLILVKHGAVDVEFLHNQIPADRILELVAELRKYDLIIINASNITITEQGTNVVVKLQKKSA